MKDEQKTKKQLVSEMIKLRRRIAELEASESENRQAEDALRETTDYLDNLFNYANAPIIVWEPDTRITRFNHALEYLTGYTVGEVIGKKLQMLFPESSREESLKKIANTLSGEYWESVEIPILRKNGDIRIVLWNSANIYAEDGTTLIATIAQGQDISERIRVEASFVESEEKYHVLFETAKDAIFLSDNTARFVDVNQAACESLGYSKKELLKLSNKEVDADSRGYKAFQKVRKIIEKKITFEVNQRRKNGTTLPVEITGSHFTRGGNEFFLAIARDITDRKKAEENMRESKILLQAVFDGISDPLMMLDRDLSVKVLNSAAIKYYRAFEFEKGTGRPCFAALRGKTTPCKGCEIPSAIQSKQKKTLERKCLVSPEKYEYVAIYPLCGKDVGMEGAVIHIKDISERKKIQEQIIRADRLSSLGMLSGGMAHGIRNPLAGISLFLDILSDKDNYDRTAKEIEIFDEIRGDVNKIDGIIKRVLDFAKPSTKAKAEIDTNLLIREEIKFWSTKIRKSDIILELSLKEGIPFILCDVIELRQVINNLVQNALEVTEKRGTLSISTTKGISSFHKNRQVVMIKVKDTGRGIEEKNQGSIFNPFFTTKAGGTGLGLAISHQIIERNGGTISCESKPGKGTTFTIELPAIWEEIK